MDNVIRQALLGDQEAANVLTENNYALPCPLCGCELQHVKITITGQLEKEAEISQNHLIVNRHPRTGCFLDEKTIFANALSFWNERPTLPIGRCSNCKFYAYDTECCNINNTKIFPWDFCSLFEPREGE